MALADAALSRGVQVRGKRRRLEAAREINFSSVYPALFGVVVLYGA
jgi:hypothetical protein